MHETLTKIIREEVLEKWNAMSPRGRNAWIGEIFGIEPQISWEVFNADETATAFSSDWRTDAERFLKETLRQFPGSWLKDYHVGSLKHYQPYSTDIAAAWTLLEKINKLHFNVEIKRRFDGNCFVILKKLGGSADRLYEVWSEGKTAPEAICKAILFMALNEAVNQDA